MMLRQKSKFAVVLSVLCFLVAWTASAAEVLVKIQVREGLNPSPTDAEELPGSLASFLKKSLQAFSKGLVENATVRFCGKSFLLMQGGEDQFAKSSLSYMVLDRIEPDAMYYLVRVGRMGDRLSQLEKLGDILLTFGDSALLRIDQADEPRLVSLGLPLAPLPESIRMLDSPASSIQYMAHRLRSRTEAVEDAAIISDIVSAVSADELRETIFELQENRDVDPPHTAYRSRYCLRIKQTDDPSDDACDNAAEYIYNRFKSCGLDVEYDPFPHEVLTQGHYEMRNVAATLPGKGVNSQRVFVISSHYDSIASNSTNWLLNWKTMPAPGANDNGSGTAAVLEAARILSQYDFDSTIRFITFSGEELGLHGSEHYAKLAAESGEDIAGVVNLDTIAYDPDAPDIDIVTNAGSEWIAEAMLSVQRAYGIGPLLLNKIVDPEMVYSDHAPFWHNGYNAVLGIDNSDFDSPEFYPFMHTGEDTIDRLNIEMAARMVQIAIATLASLADPLGGVPYPDLAVADEDIYLSPGIVVSGLELPVEVQVTAHIHNVGEADAKDAHVQVWLVDPMSEAGRLVAEEVVDVQVDGFAQVSASLKLMEWGDYEVLVKANPDYQIFETDGGNNTAVKSIHIGSTSLALGELMLYPNPVRSAMGDRVNIAYSLSKDAFTQLEIYNALGNLVYQRYFTSGEPGGKFGPNNNIEWDRTNLLGEKVSGGVYFCYVIATDERGAASVSKKLLIIR